VLEGLMPPSNTMFARLELATGQEALAHGEVEAAHRAFAKSVAIFDASPRFQPTRTLAAALLARTESALGRHAAAIERVDEAVSRARSLWSAGAASGLPHSAWLGQALIAQAVVRKAAGQGDAARQSAEEALPHLQATMGELAPETREAWPSWRRVEVAGLAGGGPKWRAAGLTMAGSVRALRLTEYRASLRGRAPSTAASPPMHSVPPLRPIPQHRFAIVLGSGGVRSIAALGMVEVLVRERPAPRPGGGLQRRRHVRRADRRRARRRRGRAHRHHAVVGRRHEAAPLARHPADAVAAPAASTPTSRCATTAW
jgi:hypothetical protein